MASECDFFLHLGMWISAHSIEIDNLLNENIKSQQITNQIIC